MTVHIFAQDIALNLKSMQPKVAANGELLLCDGEDTGVQDVILRLFTALGELFYDVEFGSLLHNWFKEENTLSARIGFEAEVVKRLQADPRIVPTSPTCNIVAWDENGITAKASWQFTDTLNRFNLLFQVGGENNPELVVQDVSPRS